ncbi:MAG: ATP-dependent zinc metalloprotease FtsH [Pirellulales bacterium]|nr:ATP-dependent zinc metalloprotease FtsH [Pirellulales bacterium]
MADENASDPQKSGDDDSTPRRQLRTSSILIISAAVFFLVMWFMGRDSTPRSEIDYSFFLAQAREHNIKSVESQGMKIFGKFVKPPLASDQKDDEKKVRLHEDFVVQLPIFARDSLDEELDKLGVRVKAEPQPDSASNMMLVSIALTVLLIGFMFFMFRRARDQLAGGGLFGGFTRSGARRYDPDERRVTFEDVAGLKDVKQDLQEVVDFLKDPERFQRLGGRIPKGVLLMGPPGTGKTLLGRAVAGEAGVPFFSISGSEFIQMFVGVGASRVRDLFKNAKEASPSILFIDEIDAIGRMRGAGVGGGHDEREQTLNQILSEMDGFTPTETVIVLAATNRPDVLDPALTRPGRFDRHIVVDRPNAEAREAILKVHTRNVPLADEVELKRVAKGTVGLTGADLQNLVNEAALWATREDKSRVDMDDFEYARDKILMGAKREEVLNPEEKRLTAYHEAGHALVAWLSEGADPVHKVTIIPRGRALGVTQFLPDEDRLNASESTLKTRLEYILGGRAAEKLVLGEYSAGAQNDLTEATKLARKMVSNWGMSERLGPVSYRTSEEHPFLGKEIHEQREFSEHTAQVIDEEVSRVLHDASDRAEETLREHRGQLDQLAEALLQHEVLDDNEIEEILGAPAHRKSTPPEPSTNGEPDSAENAAVSTSKDEP